MKYLMNKNTKATFKGKYVRANEKLEEFVYDTDEENPKSLMLGVIEGNKLPVKHSLKVHEMADAIEVELKKLKLREVTKMTDSQKVEEIVVAGFAAEKTEDEMLIEIVQAGISFRAAARLFKNIATEKGLLISSTARREAALEIVKAAKFAPETYDDVLAMIEKIRTEVPDTDSKQAISVLKKICKDNNVELPKKPAKAKGTGGFRAVMFGWMCDNPLATEEEFTEWMVSKEQKPTLAKRYYPFFETARMMAKKINEMPEKEAA